jgi:hypothetical protein
VKKFVFGKNTRGITTNRCTDPDDPDPDMMSIMYYMHESLFIATI